MGYLPASSLAEPRHSPAILSLWKKTSWLIDLSHVRPESLMNWTYSKYNHKFSCEERASLITIAQVCSPKKNTISLSWVADLSSWSQIVMSYHLGNRWIDFSSLFAWLRWDHLKLQFVSLFRRLGIRLRGWTNLKNNLIEAKVFSI